MNFAPSVHEQGLKGIALHRYDVLEQLTFRSILNAFRHAWPHRGAASTAPTHEANITDRRVRKVAITPHGKTMTNRIDAARARIGRTILASWEPQEVETLIRLMRKFADALK